jgi:hypothetical protein
MWRLAAVGGCVPCPAGAWCDGSAAALPCYGLASHCLGAQGCAPGYGGVACAECAAGYREDGRSEATAEQRVGNAAANVTGLVLTCVACPSNTRTVVAVAVSFGVALVGVLALARYTQCVDGVPCLRRLDHLVSSHEALLSIVLRQIQVLSLLYAASALPFPPLFRAALNVGGGLGLNSCLLHGWEFSNSWFLRALLPLGALPLLVVDFARLRRGHKGGGGGDGQWRTRARWLRRWVTNAPQHSMHGYSHPLYSSIWLGFSVNLFLPFALMAATCRQGVSYYDASLPCPGSAQYGWGLFIVVLYVPAFAWFFVAPLFPCGRSTRPEGPRVDKLHRVEADFAYFSFRLFRQLPQLVNAFAVMLPANPARAATLLLSTAAVELGLFFASLGVARWRQKRSPHSHYLANLAPFESRGEQVLYVGAVVVVLATHAVSVRCTAQEGGCAVASMSDYLLVGAHFIFFAAFAAFVGALLWRDHGELATCEGSHPDAQAGPLPPLSPRGGGGGGGGAPAAAALAPPTPRGGLPPTPRSGVAPPTARPQLDTPRSGRGGGGGSGDSGSDTRRQTLEERAADRAAARKAKEATYNPRTPTGSSAKVAPDAYASPYR